MVTDILKMTSSQKKGDEYWIPCPVCGKDVGRKTFTHCSFSSRGWKCFVCGSKGGLENLAEILSGAKQTRPLGLDIPTVVEKKRQPRNWDTLSFAVETAPLNQERYFQWEKYRKLRSETVDRWHLMFGVLPLVACNHRRVIYPASQPGGKVVALRGRTTECDCPKWLSASGSTMVLWGLDLIRPRSEVVIAESPADAMLLMQEEPNLVGIASTAGAAGWDDSWAREIAKRKPKSVIVWFDNDLAGLPNEETLRDRADVWLRMMRDNLESGKIKVMPKHTPSPNGYKVVRKLSEVGVPASGYQWKHGTPVGYDIGQLLMDHMGS